MTDPVVVPAPAVVKTAGQTLDASVAALEARVKALESNVVSFWKKQIAWLGTNWPHIVSWAFSTALAAKVGVFGTILKLL